MRGYMMMNLMIIWTTLLLSSLSSCSGSALDVQCLQSLKQSLGDPNGALSSWDFSNNGTNNGYICKFNGVECWHPDENRVLSLQLGNMGLQGSFPQGFRNCTSFTGLDLSNNSLSGPLPGDICHQVPFITNLNLSYNSFSDGIVILSLTHESISGEIPSGVGNLSYLTLLSLEHNRFTGPIPRLHQNFSAEYFAGNDGLCGAPLGMCNVRKHLRRVNDASSVGSAVGFVVGFMVAFYFPQWFVLCGSLRRYIFPVCA